MLYLVSPIAVLVALAVVAGVVGAAVLLPRRGVEAEWGAGNLSPVWALGICGLVAFYGYDGLVYSVGCVAGAFLSMVLRGRFRSVDGVTGLPPWIMAACLLMPQIVGAAALLRVLGVPGTWLPVVAVSAAGLALSLPARAVGNGLHRAIQGLMLLVICVGVLSLALSRGVTPKPTTQFPRMVTNDEFRQTILSDILRRGGVPVEDGGDWAHGPYVRYRFSTGELSVWRATGVQRVQLDWPSVLAECQTLTITREGTRLVNGLPETPSNNLLPGGFVDVLGGGAAGTGPLNLATQLRSIGDGVVLETVSQTLREPNGDTTTIYYPKRVTGDDVMLPGGHPSLFAGIGARKLPARLNFVSLALGLVCGVAALSGLFPRRTAGTMGAKGAGLGVVGGATLHATFFFLGLAAMTCGRLDVSDSNLALPLLAGSFSPSLLGLVAGAILAGLVCGMAGTLRAAAANDERGKPSRVATVVVAAAACGLAGVCAGVNVAFLLGWALAVAASAILPAVVMAALWRGTTRQGVAASVWVGVLASVAWIVLSRDSLHAFFGVSGADAVRLSPIPFNQPGLFALPVAVIAGVVVSLLTRRPRA